MIATIEHGGLTLAYADSGTATGPPFVFQHGLGGDAAQPRTQAPAGCRLITLECRGHGSTPLGPPEALGFETFARDLDALLDALAIARAAVGGISMGAGVALALARLRPQRVGALVLVRPAWLDRCWPPNLHVFAEIAALLRQHGPRAGKELFLAESRAYRHARAVSPALAGSLAGQFDRPQARERAAVLEQLPADRPLRPTDDWSALTMPALILATRRDTVHPLRYATALRELLPNATLEVVPSKDDGETEHRAAIAAAIAAFLDGVGHPAWSAAAPAGVPT